MQATAWQLAEAWVLVGTISAWPLAAAWLLEAEQWAWQLAEEWVGAAGSVQGNVWV